MKNSILKLLIIIFLLPYIASAKEMNIKHFSYGGSDNEVFYSGLATSDGGYVAVGFSNSTDIDGIANKGNYDAIIVKFNKEGDIEWHHNYGGSADDEFYDVAINSVGEIYVVGKTESDDIEGLESIDSKVIIVKFSKTGEIIWQKRYEFALTYTYLKKIKQISENELIVMGGGSSPTLLKIDKQGNVVWNKTFTGWSNGQFKDIEEIEDGKILASMSREGYIGAAYVPYYKSALVKYDKDGNVLEVLEDIGDYNSEYIHGIEITPSNGIIMIGSSIDYDKSNIIVLDSNYKEIETNRTIKGDLSSIVKLPDMTYLIAGKFSNETDNELTLNGITDFYIMNADESGKVIWEKNLGAEGGDAYLTLNKGNNGEYIIVGYSDSNEYEGIKPIAISNAVLSVLTFNYDIKTSETQNGTYTALQEGDKGVINISPSEGYELDTIEIINSNNQKVEYYQEGNKYYFELTDDVEVKVHFKEIVTNPNTNVTKNYIILLSLIITTISFVFIVFGQKRMESLN